MSFPFSTFSCRFPQAIWAWSQELKSNRLFAFEHLSTKCKRVVDVHSNGIIVQMGRKFILLCFCCLLYGNGVECGFFSTLTNPSFFLDKFTWYSTWLFSGFFFCSDHLFSDQLYMEMQVSPQLQEIVTNGSMVLSVISYKNLTNFLPRMYFERNT